MVSRYAFLLLLNVITSQAVLSKDTVVTDLVVETTISAANTIDDSKLLQVLAVHLIINSELM